MMHLIPFIVISIRTPVPTSINSTTTFQQIVLICGILLLVLFSVGMLLSTLEYILITYFLTVLLFSILAIIGYRKRKNKKPPVNVTVDPPNSVSHSK